MKVKTLNPVRHNGRLYQAGDALEVDDTAADALLACSAASVISGEDKESGDSDPALDCVKQEADYAKPESISNATPKEPKGKSKK